ncbi:energy-coupling factor transporter ATPase [Brevibacillus dissolubilis]|uniref:energy-coupling factor transporter ATPase n=1 Tax=Brevibacillus dissolubilis TaxID=1844116 RepID=UPI001116EF2E|nr:energy-coupling factor transporter ATPase [Brevibacillus dissolubilis]
MNQEAIIVADKVTFAYETDQQEKVYVVNGVDFAIGAGSFVSIIGHNGSGKSTLAKCINALLIPEQGVLTVSGFATNQESSVWEIRCRVGMVFQNPDNQIVGTTVEDDVAFGMENMGVEPSEMRRRLEEALQAVNMLEYADRQPHRLSGGQKQRIAIAGIMAMRPTVMILDEATAMLDPKGRKEVMELAHFLNQTEGITVINITHFPEETLLSDRVIVMNDGKVYADGRPDEVYREVEQLQRIGVDVPFAVRLRHRLINQGVTTLDPVLQQEELVEQLCKSLLRT